VNAVERLAKDARDVALFHRMVATMGIHAAGALVVKYPELKRIAVLWLEAVAGTAAAADAHPSRVSKEGSRRQAPGSR
jgi:hypothetical protein